MSLLKDHHGTLCTREIEQIKKMAGATCFIETGTYLGNTARAMRSIFDQVITIELSTELHAAAALRFITDTGVRLLHGNSAEKMVEALSYVGSARAIIWLDAHWSGGNTAKASENTPILAELNAIRDGGDADAVILVDDISYFWDVAAGFRAHDSISGYPKIGLLISELSRLNPDFEIFVNGDVLVAIPRAFMTGTDISPVLDATSRTRTEQFSEEDLPRLESIIAGAEGSELDTIVRLPEVFSHALSYGIGGHFCYWRGLVYERAKRQGDARCDFDLARKCGVNVPARSWEN